jgi:type IV pilus assembly protein PilB
MARIGELLVKENLITPQQLRQALEEQKRTGSRLGTVLTRMGYLKEEDLLDFLSKQYGVPPVNLSEFDIDFNLVRKVPKEVLLRHMVVPIQLSGTTLLLAMADPSNIFAVDEIRFLTGYNNVSVVVSSEDGIRKTIETAFEETKGETKQEGSGVVLGEDLESLITDLEEQTVETVTEGEELDVSDLAKQSEEKPVVRLVNALFHDAIQKKVSDIHIEPYEKFMRIRFRLDGVLQEVMKPPIQWKNAIVSRIKILSNLDIAERRLPQDGRIKMRVGEKEVDMRVSVLPVIHGEKVVIRLLDKSNLQLDMTKLGFNERQLKDFKEAIHQPYGMVLVTGPTGSGKTTTLYSALAELNKVTENISTAEDPVEFNIPGINQVHIREDIGLTFAAALRSFLRQDPDIIMVGEIRDFETAEIAVKAALTGHLVLSTLHTNDAPSTVNRLLNMGVEPFLVASAVNLILAQRLARKICTNCKTEVKADPKILIEIGMSPEDAKNTPVIYKGQGCDKCGGTGYKGRIALYEVMPLSEAIRELILNGASAAEIKHQAIKEGMFTLRMSGLEKIREGVTTIEEVVRVTASDKR